MIKIHVITEDEKFFKEVENQFKKILNEEFKVETLRQVNKPNNELFIDSWGKVVIEEGFEFISSAEFLVFDYNSTDKAGLHLLLGMALKYFRYSLSRIILKDFPIDYKGLVYDGDLNELNIIKEVNFDNTFQDQVGSAFLVASYNNIEKCTFNLDVVREDFLVSLGYLYGECNDITLVKSKHDPILSNLGKFKLNRNEDN